MFLGSVVIVSRDAEAEAVAQVAGTDTVPPVTPAATSYWPPVAAFGTALVVIGLVSDSLLFVFGLIVLGIVLVEWAVQAWADRATGDPETNRRIRNRLMNPIEFPAAGLLALAVLAVAFSRVFLTLSADTAVWVALSAAVVVVGGGCPRRLSAKLSPNVVVGLLVAGALVVIGIGIAGGVAGPRKFHEHEEEGEQGSGGRGFPAGAGRPRHGRGRPVIPRPTAEGEGMSHGSPPRARGPSGPLRSSPAGGSHPSRRRRRLALALVLPLVLFVASCASDAPQNTLEPEGPIARSIDNLWDGVFLVAVVVFVLVEFGTLALVLRFRRRRTSRRRPAQADPRQHQARDRLDDRPCGDARRRRRLHGPHARRLIDDADDPAMTVQVIGQQWWWEYAYDLDDDGEFTDEDIDSPPTTSSSRPASTSPSTSSPATSSTRSGSPPSTASGTPCPAAPTSSRFEADEPGDYVGQCTEYCGLSHGYMRQA